MTTQTDVRQLKNVVKKSPSATDNAIVRYDGTTGTDIQNSSATINDDGHVGAPAIDLTEGSTPSTPASGIVTIYAKPDHKIYKKDSVGNESQIGSGAGSIKVTLFDPISTSLPSGTSAIIDSVALQENDTVLFANLTSGNNQIYKVTGVGVSLVWTAQNAFDAGFTPSDGDSVRFISGDMYINQLAIFSGGSFYINDIVRFFDGPNGTDFWELTSLKTVTLNDNATDNVIFSVNRIGSENLVIDFSIIRDTAKSVGQIYITHDGSNTSISTASTDIDDAGIEFNADIDSGNIRLLYTSTNTGNPGTMKFFIKRWSDNPGGPTGIPNYSSASNNTIAAAGSIGDIQFKGGDGNLAANTRLSWDDTDFLLKLGTLEKGILLGPITLLDNQSSPTTFITIPITKQFVIIEYSLTRNGEAQLGTLKLTNNGTISSMSDVFINTITSLGITFTAAVNGSNVEIKYASTSTGFDGEFKYSFTRWS